VLGGRFKFLKSAFECTDHRFEIDYFVDSFENNRGQQSQIRGPVCIGANAFLMISERIRQPAKVFSDMGYLASSSVERSLRNIFKVEF
jgi:hypothetical protein